MTKMGCKILYIMIIAQYFIQLSHGEACEEKILSIPGCHCHTSEGKNWTTTILDKSFIDANCDNQTLILKTLKITSEFQSIAFNLFENLSHIENLHASNVHLKSISINSSNLKQIDFSQNKLSKFHVELGEKLIHLNVSMNNIELFSLSNTLNSTHFGLQTLDISFNHISSLNMLKLPHLEHFNASHNNLNHISSGDLKSFPSLVELNLSFNKLHQIEDNTFTNLDKLNILDISHNTFQKFHMDSFYNLENLKSLYIDDTNVTNFEYFEIVGEKLENFGVQNNPLTCRFVKKLYHHFEDNHKNLTIRETCKTQNNFKGICCVPAQKIHNTNRPALTNFHTTINQADQFHYVLASSTTVKPPNSISEDKFKQELEKIFEHLYSNVHHQELENLSKQLQNLKLKQEIEKLTKRVENFKIPSSDDDFKALHKSLNLGIGQINKRIDVLNCRYEDILSYIKFLVALLAVVILTVFVRMLFFLREFKKTRHLKSEFLTLDTMEN